MQGQSYSTLDKERQIGAMLAMNMQIVRRRCSGSIYRHIDLNAGSGWNSEFDVPGSPTVFVETAQEILGERWHGYFFERNASAFAELKKRLGDHPRIRLYHQDNADILEAARGFLTRYDVGSVLVDPNAWMYRNSDGEGAPVAQLFELMKRCPRMDLLANLNGRAYKLQRGAERNGLARYENFHGLGDGCAVFLKLFHKQSGLISVLSSNGHSHFVRLILRNLRTRDYRAWGWYHLDSPQAQTVYRWLENSGGPPDGQMMLL